MNSVALSSKLEAIIRRRWPRASLEAAYLSGLNSRGRPKEDERSYVAMLDELVTAWMGKPCGLREQIDCPVYLLDTPCFGAESAIEGGQPSIFIHKGLLTLLSFTNETMLCQQFRQASDRPSDLLRDPFDTISQLAIGMTYAYVVHPFTLPNLKAYLPESIAQESTVFTILGEIFVLMHEYGHIALGHLDADEDVVRDELDAVRDEEYAADLYAIENLPEEMRAPVAHAACLFLWLNGRCESVLGLGSEEHGSSDQRILRLLYEFSGVFPPDLRLAMKKVADSIAEDRETFTSYGALPMERRLAYLLNGMSPVRATWTIQECFRAVAPILDQATH